MRAHTAANCARRSVTVAAHCHGLRPTIRNTRATSRGTRLCPPLISPHTAVSFVDSSSLSPCTAAAFIGASVTGSPHCRELPWSLRHCGRTLPRASSEHAQRSRDLSRSSAVSSVDIASHCRELRGAHATVAPHCRELRGACVTVAAHWRELRGSCRQPRTSCRETSRVLLRCQRTPAELF